MSIGSCPPWPEHLAYLVAADRRRDQTELAESLDEAGDDIRTIQELLGHQGVSTTMIYTHALNKGGRDVRSPLDDLP